MLGGDGDHRAFYLGRHLCRGQNPFGGRQLGSAIAVPGRCHLLNDDGVLLIGNQHAGIACTEADGGSQHHTHKGQGNFAPLDFVFFTLGLFFLVLRRLPLPVAAAEGGLRLFLLLGLAGSLLQVIGTVMVSAVHRCGRIILRCGRFLVLGRHRLGGLNFRLHRSLIVFIFKIIAHIEILLLGLCLQYTLPR